MASTRIIEQDHGTYAGLVTHHHNGYYAGDFSGRACVRFGRHGTSRRFGWQPLAVTGQGIRSWTNEMSPVLTA